MQPDPTDPKNTTEPPPETEPTAPAPPAPETEHIEEEGDPLGANFA